MGYLEKWEEDSQNDLETLLSNVGADKHTFTCSIIKKLFTKQMKPVTDCIKDNLQKNLKKKKVNSDKEKKFSEELNNMNNDWLEAVSRSNRRKKLRVSDYRALIKQKGEEPKGKWYELGWQWNEVKNNEAWTRKIFFNEKDEMELVQLSAKDDNPAITGKFTTDITGMKNKRQSPRNVSDKKDGSLVTP